MVIGSTLFPASSASSLEMAPMGAGQASPGLAACLVQRPSSNWSANIGLRCTLWCNRGQKMVWAGWKPASTAPPLRRIGSRRTSTLSRLSGFFQIIGNIYWLHNGYKTVTILIVFARQIYLAGYVMCNFDFNFDCGALFQMLSQCFGIGC